MLDLKDKRYLVTGIANERSIGWHIATTLHGYGAKVAISVQNDRFKREISALASVHGIGPVLCFDITKSIEVASAFGEFKQIMSSYFGGPINGVVHGFAYAPSDGLSEFTLDASDETLPATMSASCDSLRILTRATLPLMSSGGSIVTLSFIGAERVFTGYGMMGPAKAALEQLARVLAVELGDRNIRVNILRASTKSTLAGSAVGNRKKIGLATRRMSPQNRLATMREIANVAAFLLSDLSTAITGDTLSADCGIAHGFLSKVEAPAIEGEMAALLHDAKA